MICIKNARVIFSDKISDGLLVFADGGKITDIVKRADIPEGAEVIDAKGNYLSPGFADIHVHGGGGHSVMTSDPDEIYKMCLAHNAHGTTSILPTTLASSVSSLKAAIRSVKAAKEAHPETGILGVHLEGPFLSPLQCGAQSVDDLVLPTDETVSSLLGEWDGIRMMGAAPELDGGMKLGKTISSRGITASVAHSNASFEDVEKAIACGYSDVTHIYSGCSSVIRENGYRIAGVVEAGIYFDALTVSVIADLRHLPVSLLKYICKCKGPDRIALITDGLEFSASTLAAGTRYVQKNGVETIYEDGVMKLPSRQAFAGSVATMNALVRNMYKSVGVPLWEAVKMASETPAKIIGEKSKGRIDIGYDSDLVIFDEDINVSFCMIGNRIVKNDV